MCYPGYPYLRLYNSRTELLVIVGTLLAAMRWDIDKYIYITPGTFHENVITVYSNVSIIGVGKGKTIVVTIYASKYNIGG